ncbi:MAG: DEAD/DEAH box helicase family protein [Thermoplasmata archaeon]
MIELNYSGGSILIKNSDKNLIPGVIEYDERVGQYRSMGMNYRKIKDYLISNGIDFKDNVFNDESYAFKYDVTLRPYQVSALKKWMDSGYQGTIVLPTAAGKSHIGIAAIEKLGVSSLIMVPTLDLVDQWRRNLGRIFGIEIGQIGGGEHEERPITVSTYDSAYLMAEKYGNKFRLIIADEVHHLASERMKAIAEIFASPYRMGLTATYERTDGLEKDLEYVMGGKVFEMGYDELGEYISDYKIVRIPVELTEEEEEEYQRLHSIFVNYLRKHRMTIRGPWDFEKFIRSSWNPEGREALVSWRRSRQIAFNARGKVETVRYILKEHSGEKAIIFSEDTETTYMISREFCVPAITYITGQKERKKYLEMFRAGSVKVLAASRVLDEGVDVPDASIAIILSGSGSARQFRQRLGRILRPGENKNALLYEVVSKETSEYSTSRRRRKGVPDGTSNSQEV